MIETFRLRRGIVMRWELSPAGRALIAGIIVTLAFLATAIVIFSGAWQQ